MITFSLLHAKINGNIQGGYHFCTPTVLCSRLGGARVPLLRAPGGEGVIGVQLDAIYKLVRRGNPKILWLLVLNEPPYKGHYKGRYKGARNIENIKANIKRQYKSTHKVGPLVSLHTLPARSAERKISIFDSLCSSRHDDADIPLFSLTRFYYRVKRDHTMTSKGRRG